MRIGFSLYVGALATMMSFAGITSSAAMYDLTLGHDLRLLPVGRDSLKGRVYARAAQLDSLLAEKQSRINYDTTYIMRPRAKLTLKMRTNVSASAFISKGSKGEYTFRSDIQTDHKATLSVSATYLGLSLGFSLNPANLKGRSKDYEFNLNSYSNRYGFDIAYQEAQTLSGDVVINHETYFMPKGVVNMKMLSINGYYALNGRRFSYPAAFSGSYLQRRSAGSWLLGFSFLGGSLKAGEKRSEYIPSYRIYVGHFGIGAGYGYNLVCRKRWLFHLSALPTLVVSNQNNIKIDGEKRHMTTQFPDLILAERAAILHQFGEKYFAGATLVMTNSLLGDKHIDINYRKWMARLFFGIRL